ncbi:MAG: HAD-IIB family hydrolase [Ignavibacteriales bacterium]|nr:HAD-IIB family hydrolase [Ignavibacteriales bacterium]
MSKTNSTRRTSSGKTTKQADEKKRGLFIQLYNIHGLLRGENLELGRNADTGGQTYYVYELAKAVAKREEVEEVEVVTRLIKDKGYSNDYAQPEEEIAPKCKIVRLQAGGKKYIKKEQLWDHLDEFVDQSIKHIKAKGRIPDLIHSHYADAGFVCAELTKFFGIPFIHTGHSLGRLKLENLTNSGGNKETLEKRFKFSKRIPAEEDALFYADKLVTSTRQEIEKQWSYYDNMNEKKFVVLPPGANLERFFPFNEKREWDKQSQKIRNNIRDELWKFFTNMYKPIILTLCRPDKRKNISGLIEAFGESKELQEKANLAIFAGIRKDIRLMPDNEKDVLTEMLLLMDKYNLYGKMAIPKRHDFEHEVPELYRIAAESGGVFVNSAYSENFGITLIEAAASGLPIVSTKVGGPKDIVKNLNHGILVDVTDPKNIARAALKIIDDKEKWATFSRNGIERVYEHYSWDAHAAKYLKAVKGAIKKRVDEPKSFDLVGKRAIDFKKLLIVDIDDTLLGDPEGVEAFNEMVKGFDETIGWGVATGRRFESALEALRENGVVEPDLIISSVGTEIHYRSKKEYVFSKSWRAHLSQNWRREEVEEALADLDFIEPQHEKAQREFKVSYDFVEGKKQDEGAVVDRLHRKKLKANVIFCMGKHVDVLAYRASKGRAIRYVAYLWNIPLDSILTAGDSGNDADMLTGDVQGVVVGNHQPELEELRGRKRIYFAKKKNAFGIIEGVKKYKFDERSKE